jgi:hypothetical protein
VDQLSQPLTCEVQAFQIEAIKTDDQIFQGHKLTTISGSYQMIEMEFPGNTCFVGMDQPLANLIAYLLEPESDGGLVKWNYFDRYLFASQWGRRMNQFPVYKLMHPVTVAKKTISNHDK